MTYRKEIIDQVRVLQRDARKHVADEHAWRAIDALCDVILCHDDVHPHKQRESLATARVHLGYIGKTA